jgi:Ca2+-binding EF-hand superfamily protein
LFALCEGILDATGAQSADPDVTDSRCSEKVGPVAKAAKADPKVVEEHCEFISVQLEQATLQGDYQYPLDTKSFCGTVLQFHSYKLDHDLLNYLKDTDKWNACTDSIQLAIDQGAGATPPDAAIQANLPIACKTTMEAEFKKYGMPFQLATVACKYFTKKAYKALDSKELDPIDGGKQFCDGNSMQSKAFGKSASSPLPAGFPLTVADWKPQVFMANLRKMVRLAYKTPKHAFRKFDKNSDGQLSPDEWNVLCHDFGIPKWDCKLLFEQADADRDGMVSADEWLNAMGVTVPELQAYLFEKYTNADEGWKAADVNGDGFLTKEEFEQHCASVGVNKKQADLLFDEIDTNKDGKISQDEYKNAFGVNMEELKRRMREKWGSIDEGFEAFDANGDGQITEEEFVAACKKLGIPKERAQLLHAEMDLNGDGVVTPDEWRKAMGLSRKDVMEKLSNTFGSPAEALKELDADGDGKITKDEFRAAMEKKGLSPEEIDEMFKKLDADGDGIISPEEWAAGSGQKDLAKAQFAPGTAGAARASGQLPAAIGDFNKRAKKAFGTPKAAFEAMDTNGDGKISPEEWKAACEKLGMTPEHAEAAWKLLDANGDGAITPEEFFAGTGKDGFPFEFAIPSALPDFNRKAQKEFGTPQQAFEAMDTDGDGKISREEWAAGCAKLGMSPEDTEQAFKELDKNGDGFIEPEEFYGPEGVGTPDKFNIPSAIPGFNERAKAVYATPREAFKGIDKDGDGKITPEEWKAECAKLGMSPEEADQAFKELDKNGDGHISPEEFYEGCGAGNSPDEWASASDYAPGGDKYNPDPTGVGGAGAPPANELREAEEPEVTMEDFRRRVKQAFKNSKAAWDAMAGEGSEFMTPEQFKKWAADLGIPPGQAEKLFKEMDKDGDGLLSEHEFQNAMGIDEDELRERALEKFGNAEEILKQADLNGDGQLTED